MIDTGPIQGTSLSVSVAMCTYNGARFLEQQLNSIAGQTVPVTELVVCDDGSQDGTIAMLEAFAGRVPFKVRVFRNEATLYPAQNFAKCIGLCVCDVVILTDQDDVWFSDRVENTLAAFRADPDLAFTFSECPLIDEHGQDLGRTIYSSVPIPAAERAQLLGGRSLLPLLLRYGVLYGTTMALRASLRPLFLPLPELWSHDEWIALTLSAAGSSACLARPVTGYRQHAGQQVGTGNWTLTTHLGLARDHDSRFYDNEVLRYRNAVAAAERSPLLRERLVPDLERKLRFLENRRTIRTRRWRAIPLFLRMLARGDYGRYASRTRSPVKDLLWMVRKFD